MLGTNPWTSRHVRSQKAPSDTATVRAGVRTASFQQNCTWSICMRSALRRDAWPPQTVISHSQIRPSSLMRVPIYFMVGVPMPYAPTHVLSRSAISRTGHTDCVIMGPQHPSSGLSSSFMVRRPDACRLPCCRTPDTTLRRVLFQPPGPGLSCRATDIPVVAQVARTCVCISLSDPFDADRQCHQERRSYFDRTRASHCGEFCLHLFHSRPCEHIRKLKQDR